MKEQRFKFLIRNKIDGYTVAAFNSAEEAIKHLKYRNKTRVDYELKMDEKEFIANYKGFLSGLAKEKKHNATELHLWKLTFFLMFIAWIIAIFPR